MRKLLALLLAGTLLVSPALAAEGPGFSDVSPDDWYAPYVEVCVEEGLMEGTGGGRFSPEQYVTSAECVMLAVRLDRLQKGLEGPLPAAPEGWGTVIITDESGETRFTLEDCEGYTSKDSAYTIRLPIEKVTSLKGTSGRLTLNGTRVFEGEFTVVENIIAPRIGLTFQEEEQFSREDFEDITRGYSLANNLSDAPAWALDAVYYVEENDLPLIYLGYDLTTATRQDFLSTLEGIVDPRTMEEINTVNAIPDIPANAYTTWNDNGHNRTQGDICDFYRAGVLTGTDRYGTFNGSRPLTRGEAAAILARIVQPELRLSFTPSPYPWETDYDLTELGASSKDWWNISEYNWNHPSTLESPLEQQILRVFEVRDGWYSHEQAGILSIAGYWLVEPGKYGQIDFFGPDGLAKVAAAHYIRNAPQGVIDSQGQEILSPIYDQVFLGGDGIIAAYTEKENTYFLFDAQGQSMGQFPATGIRLDGIREGLALYQDEKSHLWGYLDLNGKVVIPARFENAGLFYDGLAVVVEKEKIGFIDHNGTLVIPYQFQSPYSLFGNCNETHFQDGAVIVTDSEDYELVIDKAGNRLSPHRYDRLDEAFSPNGLAFYQVRNGPEEGSLQGFVDTNGVEHPLPTYSSPYQIMAYSGGYYLVYWSLGGVYNYMDDTGSLLSPTWFDEATPMTEDGRAIVLHQGQYCRLQLK